MTPPDCDLLRDYVLNRSEAAFAELVRRHLDLVYSVAKRHVRSSALAEDIAQSVFLDLSRHAVRLKRTTPLVAWLHLVTRRTALDLIRSESRRRAREQSAMELSAMDSSTPWSQIEPHLHEAIARLNESERIAVLLRFFENKSLREIGLALGSSEDAAQKRVSRALDRLRAFLRRRSIAVSAAALANDLSAHAILSAPITLASTVTSLALAQTSTTVALSQATNALAMTTTQKLLVSTALTLAVGCGLYEARIISRMNRELLSLRQHLDASHSETRSLRDERDEQQRRLAALAEELAAAQASAAKFAGADPAIEEALDTWLQKVVRLREQLDQRPELQIPELRFLEAKDWLDATKEAALETDMDIRAALSHLRQSAKLRVCGQIGPALHSYLEANNHQPPIDLGQLVTYLKTPIDPAITARYAIVRTADFDSDSPRFVDRNGKPVEWMIQEKQFVDDYFDSKFHISEAGWGYSLNSKYDRELNAAIESFLAAHNGTRPANAAQLAPYLSSPLDLAFIQRRLNQQN